MNLYQDLKVTKGQMVRYSKSKLREKIVHYWPDVNPQLILTILDQYGLESYERERTRVQ